MIKKLETPRFGCWVSHAAERKGGNDSETARE